jgi:tetratricopeptide (TPR) repeat protein
MSGRLLVRAALLAALAAPALAEPDAEALRAAKELVFDKKYAEARAAWQALLKASSGGEADIAAFWVARCSESLGEHERALQEYGELIDRRPGDRALAEEARTSRVGLAARLYKAGQRQHLGIVKSALSDPSKSVRYYAAFQLAGLGKETAAPAVPILKKILAEEKDPDIVERAKIHLLSLDPSALAAPRAVPAPVPAPAAPRAPTPPPPRAVKWLKVRIYNHGGKDPKVSVNVPVGLAELALKSLPDQARRELREKGFDGETIWEKLKEMGPTEIVKIQGDEGERIDIWIE